MTVKLKKTMMVLATAGVILFAYRRVWPDDRGLPQSLVTAQRTVHPIHDTTSLLKDILGAIQKDSKCDNFILYVHGRGKHPDKAFRQRLLTDLEKDYSARVLMFHWPSWDGPLGFPEQEARDSAEAFVTVLKTIKAFKENHTDLIQGVRFALLTQSMGSLVLEESVLRLQGDSLGKLFDTLVICASASSTKDHAVWVNQLDLAEDVYILINRNDPILGPAGLREGGRRLGKGLKSCGKAVKMAGRAVYLDVTKATLFHRYYLHRRLKQSPTLKRFFDQVLNGLPATLDSDRSVVQIPPQNPDR